MVDIFVVVQVVRVEMVEVIVLVEVVVPV
jgi:hypothetical protein